MILIYARGLCRKGTLLFSAFILLSTIVRAQGTWTPLANPSPDYNAGVILLLPDGTVLAKTSSGSADVYGNMWDRLTPDIHGSYVNGTWVRCSPMLDSRLYFSSQVLKNGTVYVAGGEYGTGRVGAEIYYPQYDVWASAPPLPSSLDTISDANSEILDDGRVLQAIVVNGFSVSHKTYLYDPVANTFTPGPPTIGIDNESVWVKLPDNSVLFVDIYSTTSERYIPATNTWVADATVPLDLYDPYGGETGAAFLLPNGKAFFIGSTGNTAYYTPSGTAAPGSWVAGPRVPDSLGAPDAAAAMMVDGRILCAVSPAPILDSVFQRPMSFYEFNYLLDTFIKLNTPAGGDTIHAPAYFSNMVCLPDGNILYASQGDDQYYIYTPPGAPLPAGKPIIDTVIKIKCDTFMAIGKHFNGITEGASYGDDWQMNTNYPIIRLLTGDSVFYTNTFNWNSTGVMRGTKKDTTYFAMPATGIPEGVYGLQVVANGNASASRQFSTCITSATYNLANVNKGLRVYPNPASNEAEVTFNALSAGKYSIRLVDMLGRTAKEYSGNSVTGDNNVTIPLESIRPGLYSILVYEGGSVYTTKLVVRR